MFLAHRAAATSTSAKGARWSWRGLRARTKPI